jgi:hypothetical protein
MSNAGQMTEPLFPPCVSVLHYISSRSHTSHTVSLPTAYVYTSRMTLVEYRKEHFDYLNLNLQTNVTPALGHTVAHVLLSPLRNPETVHCPTLDLPLRHPILAA